MALRSALSVLSFVLLVSIARASPQTVEDFQFQVGPDLKVELSNFFGPNPTSVSELFNFAQAAGGYENFLSALHRRAPHLFENYVLLHGTGSLQHASPTHPRVILFGDGLVLGFAEDPSTATRDVEVLAFDGESFHAAEIRFRAAEAVTTEMNPRACTACHGVPTKPLWEPYDFWPNAFGSAISRMSSDREVAAYSAFFGRARTVGIYRYLRDWALDAYENHKLDSVEAFTQYLSSFNFLRAAREMSAMKKVLGPLKYALYGSLTRCSDSGRGHANEFSSFFPDELFAQAPKSYPTLLADTHRERQRFKADLRRRYETQFPGHQIAFEIDHDRLIKEVNVAAQLRFIFENLGLNTQGYAMSSGANRFFMSTPRNFGPDWLTALARFDHEDMFKAGGYLFAETWVSFDCSALVRQSQEALRGYTFHNRSSEVAQPRDPPLGHCIRCHAYGDGRAPLIPFDNTPLLKEALRKRPALAQSIRLRLQAVDRTRMPPDVVLTPLEISAVGGAMDRLLE